MTVAKRKSTTIQLTGYVTLPKGDSIPSQVTLGNVETPGALELPRNGLTLFYGTKDQVLGLAAETQKARKNHRVLHSVAVDVDVGYVPVEKMALPRFTGGNDVPPSERSRLLHFLRIKGDVREYLADQIMEFDKRGLKLPSVDDYGVPALFSKHPLYLDLIPELPVFSDISVVVWHPEKASASEPGQYATLFDYAAVKRAHLRGHPEVTIKLPRNNKTAAILFHGD